MKRLLLFFFLVFLSSCAAKRDVKVRFETTEPLRVMVVPFAQVNSEGEIIQSEEPLAIDGVPLVSEELPESPPELLRQLVQSELEETALDVLSPYLVDVELPHHGFAKPDGSFLIDKIYSVDPKELCFHFLDCDAVLYGWVTKWDRSYYGLQTVNTVGLRLKLVSARSGDTLYDIEVVDNEGRGLSGGPTGFGSLVIEPLSGLDSKFIKQVAHEVVEDAVSPLKVENPALYPDQPAPSIYAAAHSTHRKENLSRILVLVYGSPGSTGRFSIGDSVQDFPMVEVEPGRYVGEYLPLPNEELSNQTIETALTDPLGRTTKQVSASGPVSFQ